MARQWQTNDGYSDYLAGGLHGQTEFVAGAHWLVVAVMAHDKLVGLFEVDGRYS
jgi:hypothetical protein